MALVTRCPNCNSAFKVTQQLLQVQEGNVRCGHCLQVFNGFLDLATLQESEFDQPKRISSEREGHNKKDEILTEKVSDEKVTEKQKPYTFDVNESPKVSRIWGFVSLFLVATLVGQVTYLYRTELSVFFPSTKPYLEQYCKILNCKITILQKIELLSIESSDMQKGEAQQSKSTLTAVIRNQAAFSQMLPSLELTLTDTKDRALASRIFSPDEYIERNNHLSEIIEPDKEISVTLNIDSGELNAAGYRLFLLYP